MIPDELFEQLLQEFSSDPVHDYILKTFSSSPLKPGETEFFYSPLGLDTFTAFDEQRSRIAAQRIHHSIPSFTEEFMTDPKRFAGSTRFANQLLTSYANSTRDRSDQTVVQTKAVVAALLDVIGTQQPWQTLQLYYGQSHDERDYFLLQTGIVPLIALAHRWFSEIVSASPVMTSLQAAWPYLLIPAQKSLFNALLSVDSFSSLTTSQRHVQLLVPFRLIH